MGQGQSFALAEHKCITSGLNYRGITRCVAPRHCASHNRFKQVENVFSREQQHVTTARWKPAFNMRSAKRAHRCAFETRRGIVFTSRFMITVITMTVRDASYLKRDLNNLRGCAHVGLVYNEGHFFFLNVRSFNIVLLLKAGAIAVLRRSLIL